MSKVPVRVFIRIRPLLEHELVQSCEECVRLEGEDQLVLGVDQTFRFDQVFSPSASQATVYEQCVSPLVKACVEGYNSTVFAYGQTGSGKSFTMGSDLGWRGEEERGVIPRALDGLFQLLPTTTIPTVSVSYIEIYKDELRDLFVGVATEGGGQRGGMAIREDSHGNTVVLGCTSLLVTTAEEALGWLEVGNSSRVTGATHMNHKSSRSHAIFTVHIQQTWTGDGGGDDPAIKSSSTLGDDTEHCLSAKFHFVDLAGSERANKTGNQGDRFKESVHINSGLLALGNVISALGGSKKKYPHIPYRDSKITRLLKDSLGGNARTVMITCLSPASDNFAESLNSLKYAKRARNIHNRPVMNRDVQSSQLLAMQAEIQSLKDELLRAQSTHGVPPEYPRTVDCSLNTEPLEATSRVSELEQELYRVRVQCEHYQTSLKQAREWLTRLVTTMDTCSVEQLQELLEWIESLRSGDADALPATVDPSATSPLSAHALQTIDLLRVELEHCQVDLQADEELFAEKLDEIADLQLNYNEVLSEKERLEAMWWAAQQSEEQLRTEFESVLSQLETVKNELSERDRVIQQQRELLSQGVNEANEQELPCEAREIPLVVGNDRVECELTANRSLIVGKVSTTRLEDFTEENVLKSLSTLNQILASSNHTAGGKNTSVGGEDDHPLGRTWTRGQSSTQTQTTVEDHMFDSPAPNGSQSNDPKAFLKNHTHSGQANNSAFQTSQFEMDHIQNHTQDGATSVIHVQRSLSATDGRTRKPPKLDSLKVQSFESDVSGRPTTPIGVSVEEPRLSRMGRSEICEAGDGVGSGGSDGVRSVTEMDVLNESAVESRKQLSAAENKLTVAHDELRNLTLKIRLKEELIRELVKTGQSTKQLNSTYLAKIQSLEREVLSVTMELNKTQSTLQRASQLNVSPELRKALDEQKRKLLSTEKKLSALQKKQKETQRLVQFGTRRERRVDELEGEVERLRNQQDMLKRKLKNQADKKSKLENDIQKFQHRIKVLQTQSDQQSKVLRVKTEEAAVAQRKLRRMSIKRPSTEPAPESTESMWLDQEVAKMLEHKQAIQALEKELSERERVVQEKEALIAERDGLAFKQLQASQATARDIVHLSLQIDSIESSLKRKEEKTSTSTAEPEPSKKRRQEIKALRQERDELVKKCSELQQKMSENSLLPDTEQRKLCELNEQIEILEAALDFKNSSIDSKHPGLNQVLQQDASSEHHIKSKLEQLSTPDLHDLLIRYINKVIELQLVDHQSTQSRRELEVMINQQGREIGGLERSLKQATAAGERQILALQRDHEQQVQLLVQQLADQQQNTAQVQADMDKIKQLEKDLYYYKKTSRDLRKKLKETTNSVEVPTKDPIQASTSYVQDSLSSVKSATLLSKGVASETSLREYGSDGDLVTGREGKLRSKVVKKSKKQLRQLSAHEIAERKSHKDRTEGTSDHSSTH